MNKNIIKIIFLISVVVSTTVFAKHDDDKNHNVNREVERLLHLKAEDPTRYEQELKEYRQRLAKKLKNLKEKNPDKYEELKSQTVENRRSFYESEFKRHPEERETIYNSYTNRLQKRLTYLQKNNPDEYERLKKRVENNAENFRKKGMRPPPEHFFKPEHPVNKKTMDKVKQIKDLIDTLPPEEQAEARARLKKKLEEKRDRVHRKEVEQDAGFGPRQPKDERQHQKTN
ncbi:MAG: hypothetical protein PF692_06620 [Kiritimatiellae bacterium]|jgi:hypothetical protein|nr:hypothetical protein [Kiritimatiellia bacterium]